MNIISQLKKSNIAVKPVSLLVGKDTHFTASLSEGENNECIVILFHGMNSSSLKMINRATMVNQQGYGFLLVDFPKYTNRLYPYYTFGHKEADIVDKSYEYIKKTFPHRKVCLYGVSMGAVAILMSKHKKQAEALVLESPYYSLAKVIRNGLLFHFGKLGVRLESFCLHYLKLFHGVKDIQPNVQISSVNTRLFLMGGKTDPYMCEADMNSLYTNAQGEKQLWIVPDAGHDDFLQIHPAEYTKRVEQFLKPTLTR